MKKLILPICTLFLFSCSEPKSSEAILSTKEKKKDTTVVSTTEEEKPLASEEIKYTEYYGSFFTIKYPSNFTVTPTEPTDTYPESDKEYVETDEAFFTSSDESVVFYVYSPQWGGTAEYAKPKASESVEETKTIENESEMGVTTTTWKVFKDNNSAYTRACVIEETENTTKIFGIQYKDQASYGKYKEMYLVFKESLEQYAD